MKKILLIILLLFVSSALVVEAVHYARHKARKERHFVVSTSKQWKTFGPHEKKESVPPEVKKLLEQPYFFLGHGRQTFVFASADGTCVLKFFKNVAKKKKRGRLRESLLGAFLAETRLSQECGILFCSLKGIEGEAERVTLLTKKGKVEEIDLSSTPFILQRRALPFKEQLLRLRFEGKIDTAKECIRSLFKLLAVCREKQVVDRDGSLIRNGNIGLVGTQAILLDTGKLSVLTKSSKQTLHDLNRLKPLVSWCKIAFPELVPTLKKCQNAYRKESSLL